VAFCWRGRSAKEKLKTDVASFGDLSYVVAGASERLLPPHLATELLIAVLVVLDVWRLCKMASLDADVACDRGPGSGNTRNVKRVPCENADSASLRAYPRAVVLVVAAVVVEDVVDEMGQPLLRVGTEVCLCSL
jgi:hypothetical protein